METTRKKLTAKQRLLDFAGNNAILLIIIVLSIVVAILYPRFLTAANFRNILNQISVIGCLACGMTFVLLIGCIDLSVGAMMSLIGILAVSIANAGYEWLALIVPVIAAGFIGAAKGGILAGVNGRSGESFIITYGAQSVIAALALIVQGGLFMMVTATGIFTQVGKGTNPAWAFFALIIIGQFILTATPFGRKLLFVGSNPKAANLSGINVRFYFLMAFMLCGLISGVAGVLLPSRVMSANPTAGTNYELDAIAACVVGGVSMKGGSGTFLNTLVGVLIMGVLSNAMNLLGLSSYPQMIVKGFVIALAFALDVMNKRRQMERG
ncbi:MAG: ABC transporter permease [Clostridia bacterium]|nr:ABC transporter permease [Clostridia bacterium]